MSVVISVMINCRNQAITLKTRPVLRVCDQARMQLPAKSSLLRAVQVEYVRSCTLGSFTFNLGGGTITFQVLSGR